MNKLGRGRLDLSLPALLGAFRRAHPAITVRIASPDDPDELAEQVRSGDAEVGITDARHASDGLVMAPFRGQQLVAAPGAVCLMPPFARRTCGR